MIDSSTSVISASDAVVGGLLRLSVQQCPGLAKAWLSLAACCYRWGKRSVDATSSAGGSVTLTDDERATIHSLLPQGTRQSDIAAVLDILSHVHSRGGGSGGNAGGASGDSGGEGAAGGEEDDIDADQGQYDDGTETTRKQLMSACMSLQVRYIQAYVSEQVA